MDTPSFPDPDQTTELDPAFRIFQETADAFAVLGLVTEQVRRSQANLANMTAREPAEIPYMNATRLPKHRREARNMRPDAAIVEPRGNVASHRPRKTN